MNRVYLRKKGIREERKDSKKMFNFLKFKENLKKDLINIIRQELRKDVTAMV